MQGKLKYILISALLMMIALFFYNKYRKAPGIEFSKLGLTDINGNAVVWNEYKGKKIIVSFGASWCVNCIEELELLKSMKSNSLSDVEIIIISDETLEKVKFFKERNDYPFIFLKMNNPFNSIGINAIPTTYIINTKLEVKDETVGFIDWADASTVTHLKKLME